jgi:predicted membrane protein
MNMERQPQQFKRSARANLLLGIVLMFLGLFLIADMADVIPWRFRDFLFTWQALLIFLGIVFLSGKDKGTGLILIAIGAFFLMPKFFDLPHYWRSLFWPSLLILLGLVVIFGSRRQEGLFNPKKKATGDDLLDDVAVFGGGDRIIFSQHFQGGKITNIFGGSKYDLTGSRLAPGRNYLDVTMIFGGSKFVIPEGWDVKIEVTAIFGGFSDKRVRSMVVKDEDKTLIISGVTIFGGGEIVNYH